MRRVLPEEAMGHALCWELFKDNSRRVKAYRVVLYLVRNPKGYSEYVVSGCRKALMRMKGYFLRNRQYQMYLATVNTLRKGDNRS